MKHTQTYHPSLLPAAFSLLPFLLLLPQSASAIAVSTDDLSPIYQIGSRAARYVQIEAFSTA